MMYIASRPARVPGLRFLQEPPRRQPGEFSPRPSLPAQLLRKPLRFRRLARRSVSALTERYVVIQKPEPVFVGFFGGVSLILGFLCLEARLLPALPGDDRMIGRSERFLFADGGDPSIDRLLVYRL